MTYRLNRYVKVQISSGIGPVTLNAKTFLQCNQLSENVIQRREFCCLLRRQAGRSIIYYVQLIDMASGSIVVGTVTFDKGIVSWGIHWDICINGDSSARIAAYIPLP